MCDLTPYGKNVHNVNLSHANYRINWYQLGISRDLLADIQVYIKTTLFIGIGGLCIYVKYIIKDTNHVMSMEPLHLVKRRDLIGGG